MAGSVYYVGARTVATAATANNAGGAIWNPSGSATIIVYELGWAKTVATVDNPSLQRISARGTSTLTVTPNSSNSTQNDRAPSSGALLDATYSVQPTLLGSSQPMYRWNLPAAVGAAIIWTFPDGIRIPPGTGLAVITVPAVILQPADFTVRFADPA